MTHMLENEPMRGFYRLIGYSRSGERERARYNIPHEPRRAAQRTHGDALLSPSDRRNRNRYAFRLFMELQSDQLIGSQGQRKLIGSQGQRNMRF